MAGQDYKADFLKVAISGGILKFGNFELKSKRISPYFFNAGNFYTGQLYTTLIKSYAKRIIEAEVAEEIGEYDIIFGPAYKGIPLASSLLYELASSEPEKYGKIAYSFDRKEAKDHGEGGMIVGAPLKGKRVLVIDDVITNGAAKRDAIQKIEKEGGKVVGIVIALDRQEKLTSPDGDDSKPMPSAIGEMSKEFGIPIFSIVTLDDIIGGIGGLASKEDVTNIEEYRRKYKASD